MLTGYVVHSESPAECRRKAIIGNFDSMTRLTGASQMTALGWS